MKKLLVPCVIGALGLLVACQAGSELNQTLELEPGASQPITLNGDKERKVGWELPEKEPGFKCPEQKCAVLERKDDFGYIGGQFGAAMNFKPKDGKMSFEIKNLAPFKLKIRVYSEKPLS